MIFPQQERAFFTNEEYLERTQTSEEFKRESEKRIKYKKDNEKFYINSIITGFSNDFRTQGCSIFRYQLPNLIEALQNINRGNFDQWIIKMLVETNVIKKIPLELIESETNSETQEENGQYDSWFESLTETQKKEAKELENSQWTENEIMDAFKAKFG